MQAVRALPQQTPVGLLAFGASMSCYRLRSAQPLVADVLPGHGSVDENLLQRLRSLDSCHLVPAVLALPALEAALGSLGCVLVPADSLQAGLSHALVLRSCCAAAAAGAQGCSPELT